LITQSHEHSFPVLEVQIHPFLDGQIDCCSDLAKEEVTENPLFCVDP
jgi:hypothetical protein